MSMHSNVIAPPFFCIVIPMHNKGPHVVRSIRSVLAQTFQDFEVIVVDDASTDGGAEVVKSFNDSRIRLLHRSTPGPGGYAARNLGTQQSRAEWVAFLDADDEWTPEHLENYARLIVDYPHAGVLGCGCDCFDPDEDPPRFVDAFYARYADEGSRFLDFEQYLVAEVSGRRPLNGSTACVRKDVLIAVGGFPAGKAKRGGDVDTWLRSIENAGGLAWSNHVGAVYYRDAVNMVTKTSVHFADCERASVSMLLGKYRGQTAKLLKMFANRRTINAVGRSPLSAFQKVRYLGRTLYWTVALQSDLKLVLRALVSDSVIRRILR